MPGTVRLLQIVLVAAVAALHLVPHRGLDFAATAVLHLVATAAWLGLATLVVRGAWRPTFAEAFGLAVLLRMIAAPLGPALSDDVWRYMWEGALVAHGVNPFEHTPLDPALAPLREPWWAQVNNPTLPGAYPPAMQLAMAAGYRLSPSPLGQSVVFGSFDLATFVLLWRWLPHIGRPAAYAVLHGLCPLVVVELTAEAHGDGLTACFTIAALRAATAGRAWFAGGLLGVATAGKYLPAVALPFVARGRPRAVVTFALALALLWLPFVPWERPWGAVEHLGEYVARWRNNDSGYALVHALTALARGLGLVPEGVEVQRAAKVPLFLMGIAVLAWAWRRRLSAEQAICVFYVFFLAFSPTVHPWYVAGFLAPLLPLLRDLWFAAFTGTVILAYHVIPGWIERGVWEQELHWRILAWLPFWIGVGRRIVLSTRAVPLGRTASGERAPSA